MKIMKYVAVVLLIVCSVSGYGQSRALRAADAAFNGLQYNLAAAKYKKALSRTRSKPEKELISYKLAECYRIINNTRKAEAAYKRIAKARIAAEHPDLYLHLAEAMKSNEKYNDAIPWFQKYLEIVPDDERGKNGLESCKLAADWIKSPTKLKINLEKTLNSKEADYSPAYADKLYNSLIFTSTREAANGKGTDNWTNQNFSDLFISKMDPNGKWSTPVPLETSNVINTESNEGNPSMNAKFSQMYFTRCQTDKGTLQGCKIMVSKRAGRSWGEPKELDLGGDSTTVFGNPSISPDELMIFFSSDLPKGQGGKDIWYSVRKSVNDKFSKPRNVGPLINTKGDEMFPFLRNDTTLYFASNGLPGLGGLDIFKSILVNGEWSKPVNLQAPINSPGDDFGLIYNPEEDKGFFASNRRGGRGSDDLYSFVNPPVIFTLSGNVKDDNTLQFVQGAVVKLTGSTGTTVETRTDAKGFYSFSKSQIKPNTTYDLICIKDGYFNKKGRETTVGLESSKDFTIDFRLQPIPDKPVVLPDILYDLAKWDLKPQYQDSLQGLIKTLDENETIIVELASHTDSRGSDESNDILSQKRAESVVNYLIDRGIDADRLVAKGYGERVPRRLLKDVNKDGFLFKAGTLLSQTFIDSLPSKPEQEAAYALNRRSEFRILSKDFVPKTQNQAIQGQIPKVNVVINPEDNIIPYTLNADNSINFIGVVNGISTTITLVEGSDDFVVSAEQTLKFLKAGAIGKTDFEGDAEKILGNNTVADKAVFNVGELNVATRSAFDLEATVSQKQKQAIVISPKTLRKVGKYTLDADKKQIVFGQ